MMSKADIDVVSSKLKIENRLTWSIFGCFLVTYVLIDLFRKLYFLSAAVYVIQDILIFVVYCSLIANLLNKDPRSLRIPSGAPLLYLFVFLMLLSLTASTVMADSGSILLSLFGLRSYLLTLPMIFVGYTLAHQFLQKMPIEKADRAVARVAWIVCLLAIAQFVASQSGLSVLPPLEHQIHSFYDDEIPLISSTFVSSKKFARFLLFLLIGLWLTRTLLDRRMGILGYVLLVAILVSGSREAFILAIIFLLFSHSTRRFGLIIGGNRIPSKLIYFFIVAFAVSASFFLILYTQRFQFMFATDDPMNFLRRGLQFFPFLWLDFDYSHLWTGLGPGSYGQETKLVPGARELLGHTANGVFSDGVAIGGSFLSFADSGLTRIIIELGLLGLLAFFVLFAFVAISACCILRSTYHLVFGFSMVCWVILFLKGHQIITDTFMSVIFHFSIGAFIFFNSSTSSFREKIKRF